MRLQEQLWHQVLPEHARAAVAMTRADLFHGLARSGAFEERLAWIRAIRLDCILSVNCRLNTRTAVPEINESRS